MTEYWSVIQGGKSRPLTTQQRYDQMCSDMVRGVDQIVRLGEDNLELLKPEIAAEYHVAIAHLHKFTLHLMRSSYEVAPTGKPWA